LLAGVDPRLAFAQVTGRCNDVISLSDGRFIHSEAFAHVVKDCSEVLGFQVHQDRDGVIVFRYIANETPSADTVVEIRRRLGIIDASLRAIKLRRVDQLEQTVAGKTRAVLCDIRMNSAPVMDNRNNR
jgi:phenylacetate-coenzyme A ligase PaaK-like adenylate-forming protein